MRLRPLWILGFVLVAQASQAADNVWFSYQNRPNWQECIALGRRKAVISPRAVNAGVAESLETRGVQVRVWVQPFAPTVDQVPGSGHFGRPYRQYPFDDALWEIVDLYGPARNAAGDTVGPCVDDICASVMLDLSNPSVVFAWVAVLQSLGRPPLFDYGCGDLGWEPSIHFDAQEWNDWAAGYRIAKLWIRPLCVCSAEYSDWSDHGCSGLSLERIGDGTIGNSFTTAWEVSRSNPQAHILLLSDSFHSPGYAEDPRRRRAAAALVILTDQDMNWGFNTGEPNRRIPELDDLYVGPLVATPAELSPGVWLGVGTHGFAMLNLTASSYTFGGYTVGPEDGLVIQTSTSTPAGRDHQFALLGFSPNPSVGQPVVSLTLATAGEARLEVFDARGRRVLRRELGSLGPGSHLVPLDTARLMPGVYLLQLTQGGLVARAQGVVLR